MGGGGGQIQRERDLRNNLKLERLSQSLPGLELTLRVDTGTDLSVHEFYCWNFIVGLVFWVCWWIMCGLKRLSIPPPPTPPSTG